MKTIVLALLLFAMVAHVWLSYRMYEDSSAAILPLGDGEFGQATLRADFLDSTLEGVVPSREAKLASERRARELRPMGRISNRLVVADQQARLGLTYRDGIIRIEGKMPDDTLKWNLSSEAARWGEVLVINDLEDDVRVLRPVWESTITEFLVEFLQSVTEAEVEAGVEAVRLKGVLKEKDARDRVLASAAMLGVAVNEELILVRNEPARFKVSLINGSARLEGKVPDESLREALVRSVGKGGVEVRDGLLVSDVVRAPPWAGAVEEFLGALFTRAESAEIELDPEVLLVRGEVPNPEQLQALSKLAASLVPDGAELKNELVLEVNKDARLVAEKSGGAIHLSGEIPEGKLKQSFSKSLRSRDVKVTNNLREDPQIRPPLWEDKLPAYLNGFFADVKEGRFEVSPGRVQLSREVADGETKSRILRDLRSLLPPGTEIVDELRIRAPREPATLSVRIEGDSVHLRGRIADGNAKRLIQEVLKERSPDLKWIDRLEVNPATVVAPWLPGVAPFLEEADSVARLEVGADKVILGGFVGREEEKKRIGELARSRFGSGMGIQNGMQVRPLVAVPIAMKTVKPTRQPKLRWVLGEGQVELSGEVSDEETRQALVDGAKAAHPELRLEESDLSASPEVIAASWIQEVAGLLLEFASYGQQGKIELREQVFHLSGTGRGKAEHDRFVAKLARAVPEEVRILDEMTVKKTGGTEPSEAKGPFVIYYAPASTWINPDGDVQIKRAAAAIAERPSGLAVLVKGYADAQGDSVANQILSEKRARGVGRRLIESGVDEDQIELIGVGETGVSSSRQNRRVEIVPVP